MPDQGKPSKDKSRASGSEGTQEREERITGSVGVQNRKGETIDQGSTTSPKGGAGFGSPQQGKQGSGNMQQKDEDERQLGGQQNVGGRQQGGVQGSLKEGQPPSGIPGSQGNVGAQKGNFGPQGNLGGQQGNVRGEETKKDGEDVGHGSRAGGQNAKTQNQPFVDEDQG